jgi:hypothetical protein
MEEVMKVIEEKNDDYSIFCKNILNAGCGKDGMNKYINSKIIMMEIDKDFRAQYLPNFKEDRK